jgi:signal transduction histidine kinase
LSPPPAASTPVPVSLDLSHLDARELALWLEARNNEISAPDKATRAYRDFLGATLPAEFAVLAQYSLGLLLGQAGDIDGARACFQTVWAKYPVAVGESGLPLQPLAGLKCLKFESEGGSNSPALVSVDDLCSNVVWKPTPLSTEILGRVKEWATEPEDRMRVSQWEQTWTEHQRARQLFAAWAAGMGPSSGAATPQGGRTEQISDTTGNRTSRPGTGAPRAGWFATAEPISAEAAGVSSAPLMTAGFAWDRIKPQRGNTSPAVLPAVFEADQSWLALPTGHSPSNQWYVCRSEAELGTRMTTIVAEAKQIPDYFGVGLEVAGKHLTWPAPDLRIWEYQDYFGRGGGGQKKVYLRELSTNVLASASLEANTSLLKVSVYLTSRSALLAREQMRSFWLAALVASAALAAGLGFTKALRAFHRQLRLSEMKSNFVSSVSHELRAPIASVRLLAESLERGKVAESGKQQEYFKFIVQECRRLSALVENVLDFSRIEQGRKQYDFEPTDLSTLTEQTVKLMEPYAADRHVTLELQPPNPQPGTSNLHLNADGKALQQALVNLIDNAIKHSPKGQTVTVGLERRRGILPVPVPSESEASNCSEPNTSGTAILLWVEDHGEGIPAAEHEKIFERFYRRGSELRRETQGVGIGLSIVRHIVEAHRGAVRVRSGVGLGSRFTIELPENGQALRKSEIQNPKSE